MFGKLLGVASIGSALASVGMLQRFLKEAAAVMILSVVCAFILCCLIAGLFILSFFGLVHYGLDPFAAGITLGIIGCCLAILLIAVILTQIRRLQGMELSAFSQPMHGLPDVTNLVAAFVDGFLNPDGPRVRRTRVKD